MTLHSKKLMVFLAFFEGSIKIPINKNQSSLQYCYKPSLTLFQWPFFCTLLTLFSLFFHSYLTAVKWSHFSRHSAIIEIGFFLRVKNYK